MLPSESAGDLGGQPDLLAKLSPREREVLVLVAKGFTNQRIGKQLFISDKTVKNYVTSIRRKLGLENRIQIALYAISQGIVNLEDIS